MPFLLFFPIKSLQKSDQITFKCFIGFRFPELTVANEKLWEFVSAFNEIIPVPVDAAELKIKTLLVYDAVNVFAAGIKTLNENVKRDDPMFGDKLDCENYDAWSMGATLLNFMKTVSLSILICRTVKC